MKLLSTLLIVVAVMFAVTAFALFGVGIWTVDAEQSRQWDATAFLFLFAAIFTGGAGAMTRVGA